MIAICVDDERPVLQLVVALCRELPQLTEVKGFHRPKDVLTYLRENDADLAVLDIDMPGMTGIRLAKEIKDIRPDIRIIFLTGYSQYALDAFSVHASGYLMKPVSREKLAEEVEYALSGRREKRTAHISARTFGEFDLFVDGKQVHFGRAKSKELLAFLIDKNGSSVTRPVIFAALWGDEEYTIQRQKYLDVIIRALRETLTEYGISEILENNKGTLRICPEKIDCDLYRFMEGDANSVNSYYGEYLSSYEWAMMKEAWLDSTFNS